MTYEGKCFLKLRDRVEPIFLAVGYQRRYFESEKEIISIDHPFTMYEHPRFASRASIDVLERVVYEDSQRRRFYWFRVDLNRYQSQLLFPLLQIVEGQMVVFKSTGWVFESDEQLELCIQDIIDKLTIYFDDDPDQYQFLIEDLLGSNTPGIHLGGVELYCSKELDINLANIAAIGLAESETQSTDAAVVIEIQPVNPADERYIRNHVRRVTLNFVHFIPQHICFVNPGWIIRTDRGKIDRIATRNKFLDNIRADSK